MMYTFKCEEINKLECPIVIEHEDEEEAVGRMIAHAKGSHGLNIGRADIYKEVPAEAKEVVEEVEEEVEKVDYDSMSKKELQKLADERGLAYGRRDNKRKLVELLS